MKPCDRRHPRGYVLVWFAAAMAAMLGILSLGVDWALKSLVNCEVQAAADAAAIAGAQRLAELSPVLDPAIRLSEVRLAAVSAGEANPTTNGTFRIYSSDIEIGRWNSASRSFQITSVEEANAVRVSVERSPTRGNEVETMLARVFGVNRLTSRRHSVSLADVTPAYALVGLNAFISRGLLTVDGSPYSRQGHIASNGPVKLNLLGLIGVTLVDGHIATFGGVDYPAVSALTIIRDGERCPSQPLILPPVSPELALAKNDNSQLGGLLNRGNLNVLLVGDIPAGTYLIHDLNVGVGALLRIQGPVTMYITGDVRVLGTVVLLDADPTNLKLRVVGGGTFAVAANVALSADVYAPERDIVIGAGVAYRGRLIGRSIDILGTSLFFLRPDLPPPELGRSRVKIVC